MNEYAELSGQRRDLDAAMLESLLKDALDFCAAFAQLAPHLRAKSDLIAGSQRGLFHLTRRSLRRASADAARRSVDK